MTRGRGDEERGEEGWCLQYSHEQVMHKEHTLENAHSVNSHKTRLLLFVVLCCYCLSYVVVSC